MTSTWCRSLELNTDFTLVLGPRCTLLIRLKGQSVLAAYTRVISFNGEDPWLKSKYKFMKQKYFKIVPQRQE